MRRRESPDSGELPHPASDRRHAIPSPVDPRVAALVMSARSLATGNAAALTCCTRIPSAEGD